MPRIHSGASYRTTRAQTTRETVPESRGGGMYDEAWDCMFDRLKLYKAIHGDTMVTRSYKGDPKLGRWVNKQRTQRETLSTQRKKQLDGIGFVWSVQKHEEWGSMLARLVEYKRLKGNTRVPQGFKDDKKLGKWVDNQRNFQKSGQLSAERKALLDEIGFEWKIIDTWDEMFEKLVEYKEKFGTCLVPQSYPKLGNWVRLQRVRRQSRTPEQKRKLNSIGFVWNARKENWRDVY